ncbi:MAG TPA: hypothetical protein VGL91_07245 [Acidobacteriota bacterium]
MKRTTIFIDEQIERELHAIAVRKARPVAAVVREALGQYLAEEKRKKGFAIGFVAVGRSGRGDTAEIHEELLWSNLDPHPGGHQGGHDALAKRRPTRPTMRKNQRAVQTAKRHR